MQWGISDFSYCFIKLLLFCRAFDEKAFMEEIKEKITQILVEKIGIVPTEITDDANLVKDLGVDSLDYAELVMEFEHTFDIRIPDQDAEKISTISDAVQYIHGKVESSR